MNTPELDYVTVNPAVAHDRFNVVIMRWNHTTGDYQVFRISAALPKHEAEPLSRSWAAAMRLDIR